MRRSSGAFVLFSLLAAPLVVLAPAGTGAASAATYSTLPAVPADSVVDSYGVGIHLPFLDTPYADATKVADALEDLGVRHVRDDLFLDNPRQYAGIETVAERGIGFDLIMGRPDKPGTPGDYVETVAALPGGAVESVEGVNEWDLFGAARPGWASEAAQWQQDLYEETKANPATSDLPVLSPSMAFKWNYAALPDLSAWSDKANAHMYPGGWKPTNEISQISSALRTVVPSKPLVVTEAGYHNATSTTNAHLPVDEATAGDYLPRLLLEHVNRGHERVYSYELIDEFADAGKTNPEANFGLLRRDWSPKPAYSSMKRLLALLDDPGPAFTAEPLELASQGWPSDGRYLVTQKHDGSHVLLLWRDSQLYDPVLRQPASDPSAQVTLSFPKTRDITVNRVSQGSQPTQQLVGSSVTLPIDGSVTAVSLADPVPAPQPADVTATAGDGSATVTWTLPSGGQVDGLELVREGGDTVALSSSARSFTDTGLSNGTAYRWWVRALGPGGASPWVSSQWTTPAGKPSAPTITSTSVGSGSVTVAWQAAGANGSPVLGYELSYGSKVLTVGAATRKATLTGLPRRTRLRVALRARNALGWGSSSLTPLVKTK